MKIEQKLTNVGWAAVKFIENSGSRWVFTACDTEEEAEEMAMEALKNGFDAFVTPVYMEIQKGFEHFKRPFNE
jgi:hypothetical protein